MKTIQVHWVITTCVFAVALGAEPSGAQSQVSTATRAQMRLEEYLRVIGVRIDAYFTIETIGARDSGSALSDKVSTFDLSAKTDSEVIRSIEKGIEGVTVSRSSVSGVVFHIRNGNVAGAKGYWLDKKIAVSFAGVPIDFFDPLQKACKGAVEFELGTLVGVDSPQPDGRTRIAVEVIDRSAREVVSCCLPFSQRDRVLWTCATTLDKTQTARFAFGFQAPASREAPTEALPFERGEDAYRENARSRENIAAAVNYIEARLGAGAATATQVRWAMLYLGKHRVVSAVSVLFKHLGYRYTTCGVVEEQFPAIRALVMIGAEATEEALRRLKTEKDPEKVALLRQVLICGQGKGKADALVEDRVLRHADREQQLVVDRAKPIFGPTTLPATTFEKAPR